MKVKSDLEIYIKYHKCIMLTEFQLVDFVADGQMMGLNEISPEISSSHIVDNIIVKRFENQLSNITGIYRKW